MPIRAESNHHTATVSVVVHEEGTEDEVRAVDSVVFTCTAPEDALCRTYPDCDCEVFSEDHDRPGYDQDGHPYVLGRPCWVKDWFDAMPGAEATTYVGADYDDMTSDAQIPAVERTGHVRIIAFDIDTGPEWEWGETNE